jgi:hypothetical protein
VRGGRLKRGCADAGVVAKQKRVTFLQRRGVFSLDLPFNG